MKKHIKRISGIILVIAMILSLMPVQKVNAGNVKRYTVIVIENCSEFEFYIDKEKNPTPIYTRPETLSASKKAAIRFVDNLKDEGVTDNIAVISYDSSGAYYESVCYDKYGNEVYFTKNVNVIKNSINGIQLDDKSHAANIESGLNAANELLSGINSPNKNVVIFNTGQNYNEDEVYYDDGKYDSKVVGSTWKYTSNGVKVYKYNNVAYEAAESLKKETHATVFSIGMFNLFDDMPEEGEKVVELFRRLARDIASGRNYYFEVDKIDSVPDKIPEVIHEITKKYYEVEVESNDESLGSVTGGGNVTKGEYVTVEAIPAEDSIFIGWYDQYDDCVSNEASYHFKPEMDITLTAKFAEGYTITTKSNDTSLGTTTGGGSVVLGNQITIEAIPKDDCVFLGWYDGDEFVSGDSVYDFVPDSSVTLTAMFHKRRVNVTARVNNSDYGEAMCPASANIGGKVTFTAKPKVGCKFDGWYRNGELVSTKKVYRFDVEVNNTDLDARFSLIEDPDKLVNNIENSDLPVVLLEGHPKNNQIHLKWKKVGGGWKKIGKNVYYEVFQSECDGGTNYKKIGVTHKTSYTIKNLNKKKAYKFYIVPCKNNGNYKVYKGKSLTAHVALMNYKATNVKKISLKSSNKVTIKKGKTARIKAKVIGETNKENTVDHIERFRYITSNNSIATVNKKGVIKGKKKGSCIIYALAHNGVHKAIKVRVV